MIDPPNLGLDPIPKDVGDAVVREAISFIPVIGDIFDAVEAIQAFREGKAEAGIIYLINFLPGPPLPLTHLLVYELSRRGSR